MSAEDFVLFDKIIKNESGWNPMAQNPTSTAFGLSQFLNSTWATVGCEKTTDPYIQIECAIKYINQRYGGYEQAWSFWLANRWF